MNTRNQNFAPSRLAGQSQALFRLDPLPEHWLSLGHAFVHRAKMQPQAPAISDSTGVELTYHQTLVGAILLANLLHKDLDSSEYVGILLPPSAGGALVNIAVTLLGKIPVNLNYSASKAVLESCLTQCGIECIISSTKLMKRLELPAQARLLSVESLQERASLLARACAWSEAELIPEKFLSVILPGMVDRLDDPAAVILTAGSTSDPKPVLLSHRNILSNIQAISQVAPAEGLDVVLGVLPFFHSFGFTVTLWGVLTLGLKAVYHYDPFDARRIASLCEEYKVTAVFCTPTIMRSYLKRCKPEQFKTIRFCVLGGEKLTAQLYSEIRDKLGIIPLSGYGLAESAPVLTANLPQEQLRLPDGRNVPANKVGTVGLPLPGTLIKIIDPDTNIELPAGSQGLILASGPQIMLGYLNNPQATALALKDGWLKTGDLGYLDKDGFLTITGRCSQFSKIGGEMVSHLAVEKEVLQIAGVAEDCLSVTSVPDAARGERLVLVHCKFPLTISELLKRLKSSDVPRLWIPDPDDFVEVEALPVLANGKLDLRKIKDIAVHACAGRSATSLG